MARRFPWAEYPTPPNALSFALSQAPIEELAAECGIPVNTMGKYKTGHLPTPKIVFLYLNSKRCTVLGPQFGPLAGWELHKRGDRLWDPITHENIMPEDFYHMHEYRAAKRKLVYACEQLDRLQQERDFYRRNCHHQAKFGMMLNMIFPMESQ